MAELRVERFYNGDFEPVGTLSSQSIFELSFSYDEAYLLKANAVALSLSLPLDQACYDIERTLPYFEGLLPEGPARESIARELRVSPHAPFDLLRALGAEAVGAVRIGASEVLHGQSTGYTLLSDEDINQLSEKSEQVVAKYLKRAKLSLAGAQYKVGLYRFEDIDGKSALYVPDGIAASTHIIKTESRDFEGLVFNESYCLALARACGLLVPDSYIIAAARPLLAIKRFDRIINERSRLYGGLPAPIRLHQEDLSQALGIETSMKYEAGNSDYPLLIARLLRSFAAEPLQDIETVAQLMIFNYLIGNCDNHIKNLSILYSEDYQTIKLAPAYDVLNTTVYDLDREMGLRIGSTRMIDQIKKEDFSLLAKSLGIGKSRMRLLLDDMRERLSAALTEGSAEAAVSEYETAESIVTRIAQDATRRINVIESP